MAHEVAHSDAASDRGRALVSLGLDPLDAMHVAYAEAARADWFASCDDELLRRAARRREQIRVRMVDPCDLPAEILL